MLPMYLSKYPQLLASNDICLKSTHYMSGNYFILKGWYTSVVSENQRDDQRDQADAAERHCNREIDAFRLLTHQSIQEKESGNLACKDSSNKNHFRYA
jgi:hypothetical protein